MSDSSSSVAARPADPFVSGPGLTVFSLRPPESEAARFRAEGLWRDESPLQDLRRWRDETPDANAVMSLRVARGVTTRLTYGEYARLVERFAGALKELGAGPGQVVAIQLPNVWQVPALLLACFRVGAVAAPVTPAIRSRELEKVLARVGASVCVTTDTWAGFEHAESLAEMAPRLPRLRHRVVLGSQVAEGEVDFARFFEETPWETRHAVSLDGAAVDPDLVSLVLFTSGTTGQPKAALHTLNVLNAIVRQSASAGGITGRDRIFTPHAATHSGGIMACVLLPLLTGGCSVIADAWDPDQVSVFLQEAAVTYVAAAPVFLNGLLDQARQHPQRLNSLRLVVTMGTTVPGSLVDGIADVLNLPLRVVWGMTEGGGTFMASDDPADYARYSVGRKIPGLEMQLRSEHAAITVERPGRLFIRGASVCLATVGRDSGGLNVVAEHDDGWYDTGDLAIEDGKGGIQIVGRAADRIGSGFMIPATDVESALLQHPDVKDVALVGYPDGQAGELACAVVVPRVPGLTLAALRDHLDGLKMTEWYWPSRLELVDELPRNSMGKVRKDLLAMQIRGDQLN